VLRTIPPLALIPLAILWFVLGFKPAVFLIWLDPFSPFVKTVHVMDGHPPKLIEVPKHVAGPWLFLFKVDCQGQPLENSRFAQRFGNRMDVPGRAELTDPISASAI
jgi:hypothetical protein